MPYPGEHSCRIEDPKKFEKDSFRRIARGKLGIIIGKLRGQDTTTTQAYRYPIADWTEAEAAADCKKEGGAFEAAQPQEAKTMTEAELREAATIKAKAQSALRALKALFDERNLPKGVHEHIDALRAEMRKAWADMGDDAEPATAAAESAPPAPVTEAVELTESELVSDVVPLMERAVRSDGTVAIKVIAPGKGSSGFYSADVLKRDAKVFAKGTKMYWDHPTADEEAARPERSLRDLAAELTSDAAYREDGPAGSGIYADAQVFKPFRAAVNELSPSIGVSIRAVGKARMGEVDGQKGPIIEQIVTAKSIDFVTTPGAGGKVLSLFEAARNQNMGGVQVDEKEAKKLTADNAALVAANEALQKQLAVGEAKAILSEAVGAANLPQVAKDRLTKAFADALPLKEGKLDGDGLRVSLDAAIAAEAAYVAALAPATGKVVGLGATGGQPAGAALKESFRAMFVGLGKSADEAEQLANIAAQGR